MNFCASSANGKDRTARASNERTVWDLNTNKVWWNEGILTLFGYRLENDEADPGWWR